MAESEGSGFSKIGKTLHDLNEYIFLKNKKITSVISAVIIVGLTFYVFNAEANAKASEMLGSDRILQIVRTGAGDNDDLFPAVSGFIDRQTQRKISDTISEGESGPEISIDNAEDKVLRSIEIRMTWSDEEEPPGLPKIRNYQNQPDQFSLKLISTNDTTIISKTSDSGTITSEYTFSSEEMEGSYGEDFYTIEIVLLNAGDWEPRFGPGLITYEDTENSFELDIKMTHLEPEIEE